MREPPPATRARRLLERHIAIAIALALPLASSVTACESDSETGTGPDVPPDILPTCTQPPPTKFELLVALCEDAGSDASSDSSAEAAAPACFVSCGAACAANGGSGSDICKEGVDASAGMAIAQCVRPSAPCPPRGRRFEGLLDPEAFETSAIGRLFAESAWLEAASVRAFQRLARELIRFEAPGELVSAARAAAQDEVRHTAVMARFARRFGATIPRVRASAPGRERSLEELATENAVEGCVGETYGAVVARWQSARAADPEVQSAFARIASDEAEHAALAWAIDAWLCTRLDEQALARVREARTQAGVDLARIIECEAPSPACVTFAGLPSPAAARALVGSLRNTLFASC